MVCGEPRRWAASSVRKRSSASRTEGVRIEAALALEAAQGEALLGLLLVQEGRAAVRTRGHSRLVPRRELAFRVPGAAVERLAAAGAVLRGLPPSAPRGRYADPG